MMVEEQLPEEEQRYVQGDKLLLVVEVRDKAVHEGGEAREGRGVVHAPRWRHGPHEGKDGGDLVQPLHVADALLQTEAGEQSLQIRMHLWNLECGVPGARPLDVRLDDSHVPLVQRLRIGAALAALCRLGFGTGGRLAGRLHGGLLEERRPAPGAVRGPGCPLPLYAVPLLALAPGGSVLGIGSSGYTIRAAPSVLCSRRAWRPATPSRRAEGCRRPGWSAALLAACRPLWSSRRQARPLLRCGRIAGGSLASCLSVARSAWQQGPILRVALDDQPLAARVCGGGPRTLGPSGTLTLDD
mmetsp:Transcript_20229/g.63471  ORF Transcript_20229/g.63471 Transcript_20229/m.63471 type:complete len:299 (-) Transcript_20229:75-971(-)